MSPELEYAEEWRQIIGFEGCYEVSNLGRVRSIARQVVNGNRHQPVPGGLMRQRFNKDGYLVINLKREGRRKTARVHKLVCEAFLGSVPPAKGIDHRDGDRSNNVLWNLRYMSQLENIRAAIARRGSWQRSSKLNRDEVVEIRRLYKEGMTQKQIGEQFGINQTSVSQIILNKIWKISLPATHG